MTEKEYWESNLREARQIARQIDKKNELLNQLSEQFAEERLQIGDLTAELNSIIADNPFSNFYSYKHDVIAKNIYSHEEKAAEAARLSRK